MKHYYGMWLETVVIHRH